MMRIQGGSWSEGPQSECNRLQLRLSRLSLVVSRQQGGFEPAFDKLRNDVTQYVHIPFSS
jgi:hypothetical protein